MDPERDSSSRLRDFFSRAVPTPVAVDRRSPSTPPWRLSLTDEGTPLFWLQAGQALGAVLLRAAQGGVMAQPLAQVTDTPSTPRRSVADVLAGQPETPTAADNTGAAHGWSPAVPLADLPDGTALGVVLAGRPVCLARSAGQVHALLDECSHGQVALSEGDVDGGFVECWLHGSLFDLTTGRPTGPPATVPVPVYPARVVSGVVEVRLPAPTDGGDS